MINIDWQSLEFYRGDGFCGELVVVLARFDLGAYSKIQEAVLKAEGEVRTLTPMMTSKTSSSQFRLIVDVKDVHHLRNIQASLRQVDDIIDVRRNLED